MRFPSSDPRLVFLFSIGADAHPLVLDSYLGGLGPSFLYLFVSLGLT